MAELQRPSSENSGREGSLGNGMYLARIISHLDTTFMGSLEVTLLKDQNNTPGEDAETQIVKYAPPFFGYTPFEFMGNNTGESSTIDGFSDTQKSYGMWFVPPDVGTNVLCMFINGDPAQGFWFACVPGRFTNNMVPAIAASTENVMDAVDKKRYGNTKMPLPVAEINKRLNSEKQEINPEKIKKVVHPIADRFLEQGTLEDDIRGPTTTSPRREAPSMVFGISTPGPVDRRTNAKKAKIGKNDSQSDPLPISRLGGTQLVMDDGDDRYHRETTAAEGPVKYVDLLDPEVQKKLNQGQPTVPYGEYFRVRTRTGHQLLMHNSEDLIYIANARGTAWIEMTSNGKIDIYARDSVSIHTENDFNLFANRDINMEAGRNINLKSSQRFHTDVGTDFELAIAANGKITLGSNYDLLIGGTSKISSKGDMNILTSAKAKYTSGGETHIAGVAGIYESGAQIHMNGKLAETANAAQQVVPLPTYDNIVTRVEAGWETNRYQASSMKSIMTRIPMHEPWALHENNSPDQLKPAYTDREGPQSGSTSSSAPSTTPASVPEREKEAMAFFIGKGWTQVQAAGIVGNLVNESRLNPNAIAKNDAGPGKDSVGIAQWNTGRLENLKSLANTRGTEFTDFQTQLEFVHVELTGAEKGAGNKLKLATTVEEATIAMTKYERFKGYEQGAASPETQKRIASANNINSSYA